MANQGAALRDIAQRWPLLNNADRSRLLQRMSPEKKKTLRDAVRTAAKVLRG
jgi:hypothetical protein